MTGTVHAIDFLAAAEAAPPRVCAVFGDDVFLKRESVRRLKRLVLGADADAPASTYDCSEQMPTWPDVADELSTASLFGGGGARLVILEEADAFVSANRPKLEDYAARPRPTSVLVLVVSEWPASTRLYKAIDQTGLQIDCRPPQATGKSKGLDEAAITRWIVQHGEARHQVALGKDAAQHLLELTGPVFGLLDQNLAKLALLVPAGTKVSPQQVQEFVGGWRSRSTWDLVDAAAAGDAAEALQLLDRLLHAGEHPLALLGSISWSLRRYAAATRIFERAERSGQRITLREALAQAGVRDWPQGALAAAEKRLMQLGRQRAGKLYRWLLELDLALKGTHSAEDRARWALEQLLVRLSKPLAPRPAGRARST